MIEKEKHVVPLTSEKAAANGGEALVLTREGHQKLLETFPMPEGWEPIAHHVTLNMGAWKGSQELLGQEFSIDTIQFAKDALVSAVGVKIPSEIPIKNAKPHITVAINRAAGGKPVMSNNLDWSISEQVPGLSLVGKLIEVTQDNATKFSDEY